MAHIRSKAADLGIKLIVVPEAAREFFQALGRPENEVELQKGLLEVQLKNEDFYCKKALRLQAKGDRVLVLFDRSLMTGKGYSSTLEIWNEALRSKGLTEKSITERYTNPIHLVTAADGAETFYVNDPDRPETPEQARNIDKKLQTIWNGLADHITIIPNAIDLKTKLDNLWDAILDIMGLPVPIEDELWYSIDDTFNPQNIPVPYTCVYIEQDYLSVGDIEERVRMKRLPNGERMFFFTEKRPIPGSTARREKERYISEEQYLNLLERKSIGHSTIKKNRYCFIYNYQYFELDELLFPKKDLKFKLEYSRTLKNQEISIPDWIPVLEDVTGKKEYKTSCMAEK